MVWDEDYDPKIHTFWVFEGGGKENGALEYGLMSFVRKQ